jgi:hypothetical protein
MLVAMLAGSPIAAQPPNHNGPSCPRAIAAEKVNTANAFSLPNKAMATANLYAQAQPGGYLFGAALSSLPNPAALYAGQASEYGSASDPFVGKPLGGVVVFEGGLALYDGDGVVGGLGVIGAALARITMWLGGCGISSAWTMCRPASVRA